MCKRKTTEEFIEQAKKVHGDKYDYSKVEYIKSNIKVCIICPTHGEFWQTPNNHLYGGCWKCAHEALCDSRKMKLEEFLIKKKETHGDKYDYSKVVLNTSKSPIVVTCPIHGDFQTTPYNHINLKHQCYRCACCGNTEKFIQQAKLLHGDKYDYSKVEYQHSSVPVEIVCPEHGSFLQKPSIHLGVSESGRPKSCPMCGRFSFGEKLIESWFLSQQIPISPQYTISVINEEFNTVRVDFYLKHNNVKYVIEYNDKQHYEYTPHFHREGIEEFNWQQKRDQWLKNYCQEQNITLLEIPYTLKRDDIIELLITTFIQEL